MTVLEIVCGEKSLTFISRAGALTNVPPVPEKETDNPSPAGKIIAASSFEDGEGNPEHANDDDIEALVQKAVGETAAGL